MIGGLIIAGMAGGLTVSLTDDSTVEVEAGDVRIRDIAVLKGTSSAAIGGRVVARLARGASATISRGQAATLIRRAVPGAAIEGSQTGFIAIRSRPRLGPLGTRSCFEASQPRLKGERVTIADAVACPCDPLRRKSALGGDASGQVIAGEPIAAGDYLGAVRLGAEPPLKREDKLELVSRAGPVTVRRKVVALQDARQGDRKLFVQAADGTVLTAAIAPEIAE